MTLKYAACDAASDIRVYRRSVGKRGGIIVMAALCIVAILGMCALAIDLAYLMQVRAEMQSVADATALAAASGLVFSRDVAVQRAQEYTQRNTILGQALTLRDTDLIFGHWDWNAAGTGGVFNPAASVDDLNAVRVSLSIDAQSASDNDIENRRIPLFFGPIIGKTNSQLTAQATSTFGAQNILLVLDRSRSMLIYRDTSTGATLLDATRDAALELARYLRDESQGGGKVGLITYDERATPDMSPRLIDPKDAGGYAQLIDKINAFDVIVEECRPCGPVPPFTEECAVLSNRIPCAEGENPRSACTNIRHALDKVKDVYNGYIFWHPEDLRGVRAAILLSDGEPTTTHTDWQEPCDQDRGWLKERAYQEAATLFDEGILLYTISLGDDPDEEFMTQMAEVTGGKHFQVYTSAQLTDVFIDVAERVPAILVE